MNKEARLTQKFYGANAQREWERLARDAFHDLEFRTTLRFLEKHLPRRGVILDAGGGPGRYTIELAKLGYEVVLLDFTQENLDVAREKIKKAGVMKRVRAIEQGSITDLSRYPAKSFDAVMCLGGPLSHVHPESERKKAVRELVRVAKKGAPMFVSVIGLFAALARGISDWPGEYGDAKDFARQLKDGDDYHWCGMHFAHFFRADELRGLFPKRSVRELGMVGLEGLASPLAKPFIEFSKKHPQAYRNWLKGHERLCQEPTVVDMSAHILWMGQKR